MIRLTKKEAAKLGLGAKENKYGNERTTIDGIIFDSKAEAERYGELVLLQRAGIIRSLTTHPPFELIPRVKYEADFAYIDELGRSVVEDVKGAETAVFRLKKRLFEHFYPELELRVLKRGAKR